MLVGNQPMLLATLAIYQQVFGRILVVLRPDDSIAELIPEDVEIVPSPNAAEGLSQSIKAGVSAALNASWVVIGLGDMPFIKCETLIAMQSALQAGASARIVRVRHRSRFGNPTGFTRDYFPMLLKLTGDTGASQVLKQSSVNVHVLHVDDMGIWQDIDTKHDLNAMS